MTGYTVHTGSNEKFRQGWDNIFKSKKSGTGAKKTTASKARQPTRASRSAGKDASKKGKTSKR